MDQDSATSEQGEPTPIFTAYRRGYDPDQVDRYVADQRRRLDDAQHRASEAERKLAAAVGQLRELHRRVAVLESEGRPAAQPQSIDTLGERIQRILQEAWEGANALRQSAIQEVGDTRDAAAVQAEEIVATARRKAEAIEEEIERRRSAYLERIEEDRARALAQLGQLSEQRKAALKDLLKTKAMIDNTLRDFAPRGEASINSSPTLLVSDDDDDDIPMEEIPLPTPATRPITSPTSMGDESLPRTMPVHRLPTSEWVAEADEPAVRRVERDTPIRPHDEPPSVIGLSSAMGNPQGRAAVFDYEEQQPS